ncbi:MAG: DUF1778 domain-containing protein [Vibrio sp.]
MKVSNSNMPFNKDSTHVTEKHEVVTIKDDIFDEFIHACDKAKSPNSTLLKAVKLDNENRKLKI